MKMCGKFVRAVALTLGVALAALKTTTSKRDDFGMPKTRDTVAA